MKKILVLLLVLAIATFASAAASLDIQVNGAAWGGGDVQLGDRITVSLVDTPGGFLGSWSVEPLTTFAVSVGDYVDGSLYVVPQTLSGVPFAAADVADGFQIQGSGTYIFITVPSDGIAATFQFDTSAIGETTVSFAGLYGTQDLSELGATLNVIPEPMTILLLGMGGLFLRRRK